MTAMLTLDLTAPHQVYKNKAGTTLPGVTTVLGTLNKESIPPWYADMEYQGILGAMGNETWDADSLRAVLPMTKDGKKRLWYAVQKRDKAQDIGTITHARIEACLKGTTLDPAGLDAALYAQSDNGLARFVAWWEGQGLEVAHSELQMVSERLQVGGTGDIFARNATGKTVYVDLKTSKASTYWPYDESIAQVSMYAEMYEEVYEEPVAQVVLVRVGKEANDALQVYPVTGQGLAPDERVAGVKLFCCALGAYNAKKALKKARK